MKWVIYIISFWSVLSGTVESFATQNQPLKVVTTLTVLKDFVEQIGGDRVTVSSLLTGFENQHTYTTKPSDILLVREADMLVQIGLGLDEWTKNIVANAQNTDLLILTTSTNIPLATRPNDPDEDKNANSHLDDSANPHIWLDPENAKRIIHHITEGLIHLDPAYKKSYRENQTSYFSQLDALSKNLIERVRHLKNKKLITHHDAWPYFARRFGFTIHGNIIVQVGTEPSARKIMNLIEIIKRENIRVIVSEPQLNPSLPKILAEETGAQIIQLTVIPGTIEGAATYVSMIRYNVETLIAALGD